MQERSVTLLGKTRMLPDPFFVLASQNPIALEGTYPLPEAQLDRFLFKLTVSDVSVDVLDDIISTRRRGEPPVPTEPLRGEEICSGYSARWSGSTCRGPSSRYISRLVAASHPTSPEATADVAKYVTYGASPRAAIALAEAARAYALLAGRPSVGFEDVRTVASAVMNHRLILNYRARFDQVGELAWSKAYWIRSTRQG